MLANAYADLLPMMVRLLPGCPEPSITQALQRSGRKFCMDSCAWVKELKALDLVADQNDYTIFPADSADIWKIAEVRILSADEVEAGDEIEPVYPELYEFYQPTTLHLDENIKSTESVTSGLEVDVVLCPQIGTEPAPEIINIWSDGIMGGALSALMLEPGKKWSNPALAGVHQTEFLKAIGRAKGQYYRRYTSRSGGFSA